MGIAFWTCCGQTWAGASRFCKKCGNAAVKIADGEGNATDEGWKLLAYFEERAGREYPVSYGRRKQGPVVPKAETEVWCGQCGRLRLDNASGRVRTNGTSTHQKFIQPGQVDVCVGGKECRGRPEKGPKEAQPVVRTMGQIEVGVSGNPETPVDGPMFTDRNGNVIPDSVFEVDKGEQARLWREARETRGW